MMLPLEIEFVLINKVVSPKHTFVALKEMMGKGCITRVAVVVDIQLKLLVADKLTV